MFGRTVQDGVDLFLLPNAQGATTSNRLLQVKRLEPKLVVRLTRGPRSVAAVHGSGHILSREPIIEPLPVWGTRDSPGAHRRLARTLALVPRSNSTPLLTSRSRVHGRDCRNVGREQQRSSADEARPELVLVVRSGHEIGGKAAPSRRAWRARVSCVPRKAGLSRGTTRDLLSEFAGLWIGLELWLARAPHS